MSMLNVVHNNRMIENSTSSMHCDQPWAPNYYWWPTVAEDKHKKALDVARMLMDKKLVDCQSVKKFIELVDAIVATL